MKTFDRNCSFVIFLGIPGGYLMEYYVAVHGSRYDSRHMIENTQDNQRFDTEEIQLLWKTYAARFWLSMVLSLHEVNQKCTIPIFSYQMQEEYNGLSRMGRNYNHLVGLGLDARTYDRLKKEMIANYLKEVQAIIDSRYCIIGFDNYSHVYRGVNLRLERDTQYISSNYTVVGITRLPLGRDFSVEPVQLAKNVSLASLPSDIKDLKPFENTV